MSPKRRISFFMLLERRRNSTAGLALGSFDLPTDYSIPIANSAMAKDHLGAGLAIASLPGLPRRGPSTLSRAVTAFRLLKCSYDSCHVNEACRCCESGLGTNCNIGCVALLTFATKAIPDRARHLNRAWKCSNSVPALPALVIERLTLSTPL